MPLRWPLTLDPWPIPLLRWHSPGQSKASPVSGRSSAAQPGRGDPGSSAGHSARPWCFFAARGQKRHWGGGQGAECGEQLSPDTTQGADPKQRHCYQTRDQEPVRTTPLFAEGTRGRRIGHLTKAFQTTYVHGNEDTVPLTASALCT